MTRYSLWQNGHSMLRMISSGNVGRGAWDGGRGGYEQAALVTISVPLREEFFEHAAQPEPSAHAPQPPPRYPILIDVCSPRLP